MRIETIREYGRPLLHELVHAINETAMLAIPTGEISALIVEEIPGPRILSARGSVKTTLTASASGLVRLLLAELPP